jgi:hypothetical protein
VVFLQTTAVKRPGTAVFSRRTAVCWERTAVFFETTVVFLKTTAVFLDLTAVHFKKQAVGGGGKARDWDKNEVLTLKQASMAMSLGWLTGRLALPHRPVLFLNDSPGRDFICAAAIRRLAAVHELGTVAVLPAAAQLSGLAGVLCYDHEPGGFQFGGNI